MRENSSPAAPLTDRIAVIGTGATAMKELWRLAAADAHVRWTVDHADLGAEVVLASALGHGRLELRFGDARATPATGAAEAAATREDDVATAPVHLSRPEIPTGRISRSTPHGLAWERLRATLGRLRDVRRLQPARGEPGSA